MGRYKKPTFPGCVFTRGDRLYIKLKGKQFATGLHNTPDGRQKAELMKEELYDKLMQEKGMAPLPTKSEIITVDDLFEEFIEKLFKKGRSYKTIESYEAEKKKIVRANYPIKAKVNPNDPNSEYRIIKDIEYFTNNESRLSSTSINIHLRGLRTFLNFCYDENILPKFNIMKKYCRNSKDKKVIPHEQIEYERLYETFKNEDYEFALFLKFLWLTGSRRKEALELSWNSIDIGKRILSFPNKINKDKIQSFPINDELADVLSELKIIWGKRVDKSVEGIFRWKPISVSFLSKRLRNREKKLGIYIPTRGYHGFRKAFGTKLIENGVSIYDAKDLMRHSSIDTTLKYYKKENINHLVDVMNQIRKNTKI